MTKLILILILNLSLTFKICSQSWSNTIVYTPNGSPVTAQILVSGDLSSTEKNESKNYWLNYYSNRITFLDEATRNYNCHAYAWHVSEAGNPVWINTPNDDKYWNDNSFIKVTNPINDLKVSFGSCGKNVLVGYDYYGNPSYQWQDPCDHSATTTNAQGYLISKWGPAPLFRHSISDCPYSQESGLSYYKLSTNACRETYENLNILSNTTKMGCVLFMKNITVANNSVLTIDVTDYVKITESLTIEIGSTFEIK